MSETFWKGYGGSFLYVMSLSLSRCVAVTDKTRR